MKSKLLLLFLLVFLVLLVGCTCVEKEGKCCKGFTCNTVSVSCEEGTFAVFKGCNDKCVAEWVCEPDS